MQIKRLFIGLKAPLEEFPEFLAMLKKLKINADQKKYEVHWPSPKNYHITLRFLGQVSEEHIPRLQQQLQEIAENTPCFSLEARHVSGFPDPMAARIVYVGCQKSMHLHELYEKILQVTQHADYHQEAHELTPHVTIGRLRHKRSITDLLSPFLRKSFGKLTPTHLTLFESVPRGKHSIYVPLGEFPFTQRQE